MVVMPLGLSVLETLEHICRAMYCTQLLATPKAWLEETFINPVCDDVALFMTRLSGLFLLCVKFNALTLQLSSPSSSAELKPTYALVAGGTWASTLILTYVYRNSMKPKASHATVFLQTAFGCSFLVAALKPLQKV